MSNPHINTPGPVSDAEQVKHLGKVIQDLRKQLQWAREDADMRKIYLDKSMAEVKSLHAELAAIQNAMEVKEIECKHWREMANRLFNPWTHMDAVNDYKAAFEND